MNQLSNRMISRRLIKRICFLAANIALAYHLFAICIAPAGMPPASPLLVNLAQYARSYNNLLFMNHGYHYFAPDPGSSTLISFAAERTGDIPAKGTFPNKDIRPRLLYHRYFMLAENIGAFPDETQERILTAYANHFRKKHGTETISLNRITHRPSSIARIQAGGKIDDPETYLEVPMGFFDFRRHAFLPINEDDDSEASF